MSNNDRKRHTARFRPELKRPLSHQQRRRLELHEAWNDMARAARGKRILQRLNIGHKLPPMRGITNTTFGGLEASGPPRIGRRPLIKGPTTSKLLESDHMKRMRRHVPPPLPDRQPKSVVPIRHRRTFEKPVRSVLEVGPHTPLDQRYHWKFPPMVITRSGPPKPQASFLQRVSAPLPGSYQPNPLRQMSRGLTNPNRARPMSTG